MHVTVRKAPDKKLMIIDCIWIYLFIKLDFKKVENKQKTAFNSTYKCNANLDRMSCCYQKLKTPSNFEYMETFKQLPLNE